MSQLHDRIRGDEAELGVLLAALEGNTRAMVSLEAGQRRLTEALERSGIVTQAQQSDPRLA